MGITFVATRRQAGNQEFHFIVLGEAEPILDNENAGSATVSTHGSSVNPTPTGPPLLLYEYRWTLANCDQPSSSGEWSMGLDKQGHRMPFIHRQTGKSIEDTHLGFAGCSAQIEIYFPTTKGWRVRDRAASVNYLAPLPPDFHEVVAKDWREITPILEGASKVAEAAGSFAGPAATESAKALAALAQVKCNSVPQDALPWSVTGTANVSGDGFSEGIVWTLSAKMLAELGGRVTGGVVVTILPAVDQDKSPTSSSPEPGEIRGRAILYCEGRAPVPLESLSLKVKPCWS